MAWIEAHQSLRDHRKVPDMADRLDMPEAHVVGHLVYLWLWALDNAQDGRLVERRRHVDQFASARRALRNNVIARDGYVCGLCGGPVDSTDVDLDHIIPASKGGPTTLDNLRVTHSRCNRARGNRP